MLARCLGVGLLTTEAASGSGATGLALNPRLDWAGAAAGATVSSGTSEGSTRVFRRCLGERLLSTKGASDPGVGILASSSRLAWAGAAAAALVSSKGARGCLGAAWGNAACPTVSFPVQAAGVVGWFDHLLRLYRPLEPWPRHLSQPHCRWYSWSLRFGG